MKKLLIVVLGTAVLSACGNNDAPLQITGGGGESPVQSTSPVSDQLFSDDTDLINTVPNIIRTRTLADTGIRIGYTSVDQLTNIDVNYIERQWQHMQTCTAQIAVAPFIVVTEGVVEPLTQNDDVIFNIDGIPTASSSAGLVPTIQVREADFDGSLGNIGFNLRSILGRYLWLSANLAERDYPFTCARTPG